jgi:hypothetical protein
LGVETVTFPESIISVNKCAFQNCLFLVQSYYKKVKCGKI